jgi:hypothetical protein
VNCLGAVKICALDCNDDDGPRGLSIDGKTGRQRGVGGDCRAAFDAQALAAAGNQKVDRDAWIAKDITQAVNSIVAIAIWDHQRLFVNDAHEARGIAARRAIHAIRADSRQRQVGRSVNEWPGTGRLTCPFLLPPQPRSGRHKAPQGQRSW